MGFASCGNKTTENAELADTTAVDSVMDADAIVSALSEKLQANDPAALAALSQQAQQTIADLIAKGDTALAKEYASKIKEFVNTNADKIKEVASGNETINGLVKTVQATSVTDLANQAAAAIKADATQAANDVKDAADQKVEETKEAAKAKVNEKVNESVDAAKNKANEQIDAAKNKANEATNKALNKIGL
jgi:copper homeostasis protein CutC